MLDDLLARLGGPKRAMMAAVGVGAAVAILLLSRAATAPTWVPAISNVPLESSAGLAERLDRAGIRYKLDKGGAEILVAQEDMARARVTLAKDGIPGGNRPGLELFDRPSWGWNDFTQRVNYRRALEGELERTIGGMRGVKRAEVHLALQEQAAFRRPDERSATASVLVALEAGATLRPDVVQGIAHLVSASVDGLGAENVSIHDESGRMWSEPNDKGVGATSSRQLRQQQDVERYLEQKAEGIVGGIVGAGNARVQVAAQLNFDRIERTTQSVDPEKQALASEQKAEIVPGAQGGAGSTNVANSYENSKSTEVFSGAAGNVTHLSVAVVVNDKRLAPTGVADTVPRFQTRTPDELKRIEVLVRNAVGIDSLRGDALSVVSVPMEAPRLSAEPASAGPDLAQRVQQWQGPTMNIAAILLAIFVALSALQQLKKPLPAGTAFALRAGGGGTMAIGAGGAAPVGAGAQGALAAGNSPRDRAAASLAQDPDAAARVVKSWLQES